MFELSESILDKIRESLNTQLIPAPVGPQIHYACGGSCSSNCTHSCKATCKGSCQGGCTRSCKGHSR